jgi:hypothetical protein
MVEPAVALILTGTALIINAAVNNNSVYMHIIGAILTVAGVLLVFFGTAYFKRSKPSE